MTAEFFGSLKRAQITQQVAAGGHWEGTAQGYRIRFDLLPKGKDRRVAWSVETPGWRRIGVAGTVFEAFDEIARCASKRLLQREAKPEQGLLF